MSTLLEVRDLTITLATRRLCDRLELQVESGQCWGVLGRNGAGKTTLLHTLAGLRAIDSGEIRLTGIPLAQLSVRERARRIGLLFQQAARGLAGTVLESVLIARHPHRVAWHWESSTDLVIASEALTAVDLAGWGQRSMHSLSGGELRRVEIARLLAQQPRLALLDEPLNHLDMAQQMRILATLRERLARAPGAAIMAMHDLNLALRSCSHWLVLHPDGSWRAGPAATLADPDYLGEVFGHGLLRVQTTAGPALVPDTAPVTAADTHQT